MASFTDELRETLDRVPVVDPHCHLSPARPAAADLADIVLYHHVWIELLSAGLPPETVSTSGLPHELIDPGLPPLDRVKAALPYLAHLRNTTCGYLLRTLLADLYDVPGGQLTADNVAAVAAEVARRAADPGWLRAVLVDRCHYEKALTVEGSGAGASDLIERGREGVPTNLTSGKAGPQETLHQIEQRLGRQIWRAGDYGAGMYELGKEYSAAGLHYVGLWLQAHFSYQPAQAEEITTAAIECVRDGRYVTAEEQSSFTCYGLQAFFEGLRTGPLRTIQLLVGAEVLPPHRSVTQWGAGFPGALARLAGDNEDLHFNVSSASDQHLQDLAILAKHIPNISVAGYWWHTLYPRFIRKAIETRLDIVPANKIVSFFSDAYHAEWCYPKLKLVKRIFGEVLAERVAQGWITPEGALSLVRETWYGNPKRIYGV
jgi:glucuronate isomerase